MKIIQSKEQETRVFFFFLMSIHIKGITFLREKKNGLAEEIMAKNFLNLVKDGNIQI